MATTIEPATTRDLEPIARIYELCVLTSARTFDLEPEAAVVAERLIHGVRR